MASGVISTDLYAKCLPALNTGYKSCEGMTLCDVSPITWDQWESIFKDPQNRWRPLAGALEADFTGKACGLQRNGFSEFLKFARKPMANKINLRKNASRARYAELEPFLTMDRKSPINSNYWTVTGGSAVGGTFEGNAYNYSAVFASQGSLPADAAWFPPRWKVTIRSSAFDGTSIVTVWEIVGAQPLTATTVRVYMLDRNAATPIAAARKVAPTGGWAFLGTPNVNRHEAYCPEMPVINPNQRALFWYNESRRTICWDELNQMFMDALREGNDLYRNFIHVDEAERVRQYMHLYDEAKATDFLFSPPLANQNPTDWENLETFTVYSDATEGDYLYLPFEGKCVGRKANAVGQYWQLAECSRVWDLQGVAFNFFELVPELRNMWRIRKANGLKADVIEIMVPMQFADYLDLGIRRYIDQKMQGYDDKIRYTIELKPGREQGPYGTYYRKYLLSDPPVELRVVSSVEMDDLFNAATAAGYPSAGAWALIMDWETAYEAVLGSKTYVNESGTAQEIAKINSQYLCVPVVPKKRVKHFTEVFAFINECPQASLWIEGYDPDAQVEWRGTYGSIQGGDPMP